MLQAKGAIAGCQVQVRMTMVTVCQVQIRMTMVTFRVFGVVCLAKGTKITK